MGKFDDYINVTAPLHSATTKGKLGNANEIFLEGDTKNIENEIKEINSRHENLNKKHDALSSKHESLSKTVQGIAATGGASTANNVTYNNDTSGLNAENAQDAIDELQSSKFDKTLILQESGEAEDKVMSQKAVSDKLSDLSKSIPIISVRQQIKLSDIQKTSLNLNKDTFELLSGYQFLGSINYNTPIDNAEERSYYISSNSGIYTNCGNIEVKDGEVAFLLYKEGKWHKISTKIASVEKTDSIKNVPSTISKVIKDVYAVGNTSNVLISYISFKNDAYGVDSIGMNVKYVDADGVVLDSTEDSLYIENVSRLSAGQLVHLKHFSMATSGKATNNVNYYLRLSDDFDWETIVNNSINTNITITQVGEGSHIMPFINNAIEAYNLDSLSFKRISTPSITANSYYNQFSEIFTTGSNGNYDIIVSYLGFNHSAFKGDNYLGFQLGYAIGNKVCSLSNFAVDAHLWGPNELHEIPNYYKNAMSDNGVKLFVRTSKNFKWRTQKVLLEGNLLKLQKNRIDIDVNAFTPITVGRTDNKDFSTLRSALDFVASKANATNKFKIILSSGTYELTSEYTEDEIKTLMFRGYDIPDYVYLIGDNSNGDVIISGKLSDELAKYDRGNSQLCGVYLSVLNAHNTCWLENITVVCKNIKYPIHDDWATTSLERTIKNCVFHHLGGDGIEHGYCHGYGGGCRANGKFYYENCKFISDVGYGYLMHSSKNWKATSSLYFKNCIFESYNPNKPDVTIQSLGNGLSVKSPVFFETCQFNKNGLVVCDGDDGSIGWDWDVSGIGNALSPIYAHSAEIQSQHYVAMIDETKKLLATDSIEQFKPLCLIDSCSVRQMTSSDEIGAFIGISLNNAASEETVFVKTCGYLHFSELGLKSIKLGDKVTIKNGIFVKTNENNTVGVCDIPNFIRLTLPCNDCHTYSWLYANDTDKKKISSLISDIFVVGNIDEDKDLIVSHFACNNSNYGGANRFGLFLRYTKDYAKYYKDSTFICRNANLWEKNHIYELDYYGNYIGMKTDGVRVFIKTSNTFSWTAEDIFIDKNIIKINKNGYFGDNLPIVQMINYNKPYENGFIKFTVPVNQVIVNNSNTQDSEIDNEESLIDVNCILKLPKTYMPSGKKTKLVMICHGAGRGVIDFTTSTGRQPWCEDEGYNKIVEKFISYGYAVFDCNGYANDDTGCNFWGAQRGLEAYRKAYSYLISNYNVEENISVYGFSMGGCTALNLAFQNFANIKVIALGSPVVSLDEMTYQNGGGIRPAYGLSKDAPYNKENFLGNDPYQNIITISDKKYCFKTLPPVKVWFGSNETWPQPDNAKELVSALKNSGGKAEFRSVEGRGHEICYGGDEAIINEIVMFINRYG